MKTLITTRKSKTAIAIAALSALAVSMVAPASATASAPLAAAIAGTATLPVFPGTGSGSFSGTAVGVHGTAPLVAASASASFSYDDTLIVVGTANGTLTGGGHSTQFSWIRVGVTAVLLFDGTQGAAVAAFAPTSVPGPGVTALVGGAGADSA